MFPSNYCPLVARLAKLACAQKHNPKLNLFKVTLNLDSSVGGIVLGNSKNVVVMEEPNALIGDDGSITLSSGHYILNLNFEPISNVKEIRIDVMATDASNGNVVLNEIEINPHDQIGRFRKVLSF